MAPNANDAGHPAVLDIVPDPRLRLDGYPVERGAAEPVPDLDRPDRQPTDHSEYQHGSLYRHRLHLFAIYGYHDTQD